MIENYGRELMNKQLQFLFDYHEFEYYFEVIKLSEENDLYLRQKFYKRLQEQKICYNKLKQAIQSMQLYNGLSDSIIRQNEQIKFLSRIIEKINKKILKYKRYQLETRKESNFGTIDQEIQQQIHKDIRIAVNNCQNNSLLLKQLLSHQIVTELHMMIYYYNKIIEASEAYKMKNYQQTLELCLKNQLINYDNLFLKAKSYYKLQKYEEQLEISNQLEKLTKNDQNVTYYQGKYWFKVQNLFEAQQIFFNLIQIDEKFYKAYEKLGLISKQKQDLGSAIQFFTKSIELNNKNMKSLFFKGNGLVEVKMYIEAILMYDQALQINPIHAATYCNKGKALLSLGRDDDAILVYCSKKFQKKSFNFCL